MPCSLEKRFPKLRKDSAAIPLCAFYRSLIPGRVKDKKREYSCPQAILKDKDSTRCC